MVVMGTPTPCTISAATGTGNCGSSGPICPGKMVNPQTGKNVFNGPDINGEYIYFYSPTGLDSSSASGFALCKPLIATPIYASLQIEQTSQPFSCTALGRVDPVNETWSYEPSPGGTNPNPVLTITYNGGKNYNGGGPRETVVVIQCDPAATADVWNKPANPNGEPYTFTMTSKWACPGQVGCAAAPGPGPSGGGKKSGLKVGWLLTGLFIGLSFAYVVGGVALAHRTSPELSWSEKLPHREFWGQMPDLVKNGFLFCKAKITGSNSHNDTYTAI